MRCLASCLICLPATAGACACAAKILSMFVWLLACPLALFHVAARKRLRFWKRGSAPSSSANCAPSIGSGKRWVAWIGVGMGTGLDEGCLLLS